MTGSPTPEIGQNSPYPFLGAAMFSLLTSILLWMAAMPLPMIDDLFFIGAGLHLSEGGGLENPLIARQEFPSARFFMHPPLHSYLLAGWCKALGISTVSLLGFQNFFYLVFCVSMISIFRSLQFPFWLWFCPPLAVIPSFLHLGLRPEAAAAALIFLGVAVMLAQAPLPGVRGAGLLVCFLGSSVSARLAIFGLILSFVFFWPRWPTSPGPWAKKLPRWSAGAALALLLNFFLISFDIGTFWQNFLFHASYRTDSLGLLSWVKTKIGLVQLPFLLFAGLLLGCAVLYRDRQKNREFRIGAALMVVVLLCACWGLAGHGVFCFVFFSSALFISLIRLGSFWTKCLAGGFLLCLATASLRFFVYLWGISTGHISLPEDKQQAWRAQPPPWGAGVNLLVDSWTFRFLMDYRLQKNVYDWSFSSPFPGTLAMESPPHPNDYWLLGPVSLSIVAKKYLVPEIRVWDPLGSPRWAFPLDFSEFFVINPFQLKTKEHP